MKLNNVIAVLSDDELSLVEGGFFWVALPLIIAAGYALGKDRAIRDNQRASG